MITKELPASVQINNGLKQTCADGACLAFDTKYGIMFCAYMPGYHGDYGESRGKIALSWFPASQPTNIRFIDVAEGDNVYVPNIISLGDGKVRVFYERHSRAEGDHPVCYKDFDFISETLGEEQIVTVTMEDGTSVPLGQKMVFAYLEQHGFHDHRHVKTEQTIVGGCTFFRGEDGYHYGAIVSEYAEAVLFRSKDNIASIEFFAIYPRAVEYEFDYKYCNGTLYAIYRTNQLENGTSYAYSRDNGKTWSEPVALEDSIRCRPRLIVSNNRVILAYNYFNDDYGNRPRVIMGRTAIRIGTVDENDAVVLLADLHSKYGIVNIALADIMGDVYMAYSTSESALEYQNGTPHVRGKDAVRYVKLGDLMAEEKPQVVFFAR